MFKLLVLLFMKSFVTTIIRSQPLTSVTKLFILHVSEGPSYTSDRSNFSTDFLVFSSV